MTKNKNNSGIEISRPDFFYPTKTAWPPQERLIIVISFFFVGFSFFYGCSITTLTLNSSAMATSRQDKKFDRGPYIQPGSKCRAINSLWRGNKRSITQRSSANQIARLIKPFELFREIYSYFFFPGLPLIWNVSPDMDGDDLNLLNNRR